MKIPPYWTKGNHTATNNKGKQQSFWAWGWSFESLVAAKQDAIARAKRIFDCISRGTKPDSYEYLERPLREEILKSVAPNGQEAGIITRNRYGALVLNCPSICFVDIDIDKPKPNGAIDAVLMLFSSKRRKDRTLEVQQSAVQNVRDWFGRRNGHSLRVYETAAGLRLLFTDRYYDPVSREVSGLLEELGSDVLYRKLTLKQECFRARLTPKPWRCGYSAPPNRYPWETKEAEGKYRNWLQKYEAKSNAYGTCRLLELLGDSHIEEPIASVVKLHDSYTCRDGMTLG